MRHADIAWVAMIECETSQPWSIASLEKELKIPRGIQIVAETSDSQIIGWCCCRTIQPEAELLKIAVSSESRELGVASSLLDFLMEELLRSCVTTLFLEVRSENLAAVNLYRKNGFKQVGNRPGYYSAPYDNALIFQKNLR